MGDKIRTSGDDLERGAGGAPISPDVSLENAGVTEAEVAEREAAEGVQVGVGGKSRTQSDREQTGGTVTVPNEDEDEDADDTETKNRGK